MTHHAIPFADLTARPACKVMIGTVVPRPIAWVTTVLPEGVVNAAPCAFFDCLSADPPILARGVETKPDGRFSDTAWNIRRTEVFTVNICDMANLVPMSGTAAGFAPETEELAVVGLPAVPGTMIDCPRIAEAPVAFEFRRHVSVAVSGAREIILGRIEMAHVRDDIIDLDTHCSDARRDVCCKALPGANILVQWVPTAQGRITARSFKRFRSGPTGFVA